MDIFIIIGLISGVLAGTWAIIAGYTHLIVFAGFLAWSSFYTAGGKKKGFKLSLLTNLSGVFWGFLSIKFSALITPYVGATAALGLSVGLSSFMMCYQCRFSLLSFIPGSFIGCSIFFATGLNLPVSLICIPIGACIGYISEVATDYFDIKFNKKNEDTSITSSQVTEAS